MRGHIAHLQGHSSIESDERAIRDEGNTRSLNHRVHGIAQRRIVEGK
jgi:hypothetical protein